MCVFARVCNLLFKTIFHCIYWKIYAFVLAFLFYLNPKGIMKLMAHLFFCNSYLIVLLQDILHFFSVECDSLMCVDATDMLILIYFFIEK